MDLSGLSVYKIIFMAELLGAELMFCSSLQWRSHPVLRLGATLIVCFAIAIFFPLFSYNALYTSFMFFTMFLFTIAGNAFCYKESWRNILFCCIAGYSLQHLAYEMYNLFLVIFGLGDITIQLYGSTGIVDFNALVLILYIAVYLSCYLGGYFLFAKKIRDDKLELKSIYLLVLVALIILFDIVMNAVIVYHVSGLSGGEEKFMRIMAGIYNIFCCGLALFIQFELSLRRHLEDEVDMLQQLRFLERQQYESLKENVDIINMKCHDIKHQLLAIGRERSISSSYLQEMEEAINIYDSSVKTGNPTLDIILTDKSLRCSRNRVRFSCIADASWLSFMAEEDLYSLFGNLLDNAIESVIRLDEERRVIGVQVRKEGDKGEINVYNSYEGALVFKDGLPLSTKGDDRFHGFGIRSIQYICTKYHGDLLIRPHDGIFDLTIGFALSGAEN